MATKKSKKRGPARLARTTKKEAGPSVDAEAIRATVAKWPPWRSAKWASDIGLLDEFLKVTRAERNVWLARALIERGARLDDRDVDEPVPASADANAKPVELEISAIARDPELQPRAELDHATVEDYRRTLDQLPPVTVFRDASDKLWLADGHIRVAAHEAEGRTHVQAIVKRGPRREAVYHALGASRTHGQRLSNADKRRAVKLMLADSEWVKMSDSAIAKHIGVSHTLVAKLRPDCNARASRRIGRDGRELKTSSIGRRRRGPNADRDRVESSDPIDSATNSTTPGAHSESDLQRFKSVSATDPVAPAEPGPGPRIPTPRTSETDQPRGLPAPALMIQRKMDAIVTGARQMREAFNDVWSAVPGHNLLAVNGAQIETHLNMLERMLLAVTPDRACPDCAGDTPCLACQGGRWVAQISMYEAVQSPRS